MSFGLTFVDASQTKYLSVLEGGSRALSLTNWNESLSSASSDSRVAILLDWFLEFICLIDF